MDNTKPPATRAGILGTFARGKFTPEKWRNTPHAAWVHPAAPAQRAGILAAATDFNVKAEHAPYDVEDGGEDAVMDYHTIVAEFYRAQAAAEESEPK